MPSHWFGWILSRHCPEVKGGFRFSQKYLRPRQKQQCQNQNKPGQPEAVVPGGDFFALHGQTSLCIRALRHPMPGCADCVRAQNVVHCYRQITEELLC